MLSLLMLSHHSSKGAINGGDS